jgi:mitochondrial transcription factor 1
VSENYRPAALNEVDDRISLRHSLQPRIQWDQRPFEPLVSREEEAWPRNRLALVSASPKPKPIGEDSDWYEWIQDFVHALYSEPMHSITSQLQTMQHGLQDIIKDCPSFRDPDRGGRIQLKHLRVRMLTMDMISELVRAYRDWPFKAPGTDHCRYFRHKKAAGR